MIKLSQNTVSFHIDHNSGLVISVPSPLQHLITANIERKNTHLCQEKQPFELARMVENELHTCLNLDEALYQQLKHFSLDKYPYLIFKKLIDIKNIPPTPTESTKPPLLSRWHTPAAALLGTMHLTKRVAAAFADETNGRLAFMVTPISPGNLNSERSISERNFHTEIVNGYFADEAPGTGVMISPDTINMICLRNPHHVATTVLPLHSILKHLNYTTVMDLMRPEYTAISQPPFEVDIITKNISVISKDANNNLRIRYSHSKLKANTDRAEQALQDLNKVIENKNLTQQVILSPGDALLINNRTCLHGRDAIGNSAKFDGNDRWLIRMYGYTKASLDKTVTDVDASHIMHITRHTMFNNNSYRDNE